MICEEIANICRYVNLKRQIDRGLLITKDVAMIQISLWMMLH